MVAPVDSGASSSRAVGWLGYHAISAGPFVLTGALLLGVERGSQVDLPLVWIGVVLVALRQANVFVVTALYHRAFAHRSVTFAPAVETALRLWGWLFTGLGVRSWALVHRWHHALGDGPDAPFSPSRPGSSMRTIGRETVAAHWSGITHPEALARYGADLPTDRLERWVHADEKRFFGVFGLRMPALLVGTTGTFVALGLPWPWAPGAAVASLPALSGAVASASIFVVNGLGHCAGYRSFDTRDTSHNVVALDWLGLGEALHNNHHAFPGSARFARGPGELDLGLWILRAMQRIGWVTELRE